MSNPLRAIGLELWYWLGYKLDVKPEHMGAVPIYPPTIYQDTPETQQTLARLVAENDELKANCASAWDEISRLRGDNDRLTNENEELKAAKAHVQLKLADAKKERDGLEEDYTSTLADLVGTSAELDTAKAEITGLRAGGYTTCGPGRPNAKKLTKREVALVHEYHRAGWTNADIARSLDVNPATISRTVRGQYHKGKK